MLHIRVRVTVVGSSQVFRLVPRVSAWVMPIHNAYVALLRVERSARLIRARRAIRPIADVWVIG